MGTIAYIDEEFRDVVGSGTVNIEVGTTGYAGEGPQMYVKVDDRSVILSHKDAAKLCEAFAGVATYLGYPRD
ncbi:hypothetical protein MesoLjLb_77450 [Mesorhizobium sp. L-8-3]|nr:hypothetical protein MesoLjLb_77450 [Mesorhizobium sp. L-8-3]